MPRGRPRKNAAGATTIAPAAPHARANNQPQVPFARKLVLSQWLPSLFNVKRFEDLAEHLRHKGADTHRGAAQSGGSERGQATSAVPRRAQLVPQYPGCEIGWIGGRWCGRHAE